MKVAAELVLGVLAVLIAITDTTPIRFLTSRRRAHTRRTNGR